MVDGAAPTLPYLDGHPTGRFSLFLVHDLVITSSRIVRMKRSPASQLFSDMRPTGQIISEEG